MLRIVNPLAARVGRAAAALSCKSNHYFNCLNSQQPRAAVILQLRSMAYSVDFEVHGRVHGVFFRACTQEKAKALGVVGHCCNTDRGTVKGVAQSEDRTKLDLMMVWLSTEGSPSSRIDRCDFNNVQNDLKELEYPDFSVRR